MPLVVSRLTDVIAHPRTQGGYRKEPEDGAKGPCHTELNSGRLSLQMKRQDNRDTDDGHGDGESEVREEGLSSSVRPGTRGDEIE